MILIDDVMVNRLDYRLVDVFIGVLVNRLDDVLMCTKRYIKRSMNCLTYLTSMSVDILDISLIDTLNSVLCHLTIYKSVNVLKNRKSIKLV